MNRLYGWKPDIPDHRDMLYKVERQPLYNLPPMVDIRPNFVLGANAGIFDQLTLGSCTANSTASAYQYELVKQNLPLFTPARLFLYYDTRKLEGTVKQDAGAMIRDVFKTLANQGICSEAYWPYEVAKFSAKPSPSAYTEAIKHKSLQYARLDNTQLGQLKQCLANGYPFVFGFSVYSKFESEAVAVSGIVDLPGAGEQLLGGHAVLCVGYDDASGRFLVQNSWGKGWGMGGFFTIPYAYLTNPHLADDFWTLRLVKG